jgi:hypothetical protein
MTMQMILKARDGYLLASDQKLVDEQLTRTAMYTEKMVDLPKHKVIYMVAGDECAIKTADDLGDAIKDGQFNFSDIGRSLRDLCDKRWKLEDEYLRAKGTNLQQHNRTLLALFYGICPAQVWKTAIQSTSNAYPLTAGFAKGGAVSNTAWFFLNRYHNTNRSITDLLPLAVHTLSMGSALDPVLIGGFQVFAYYTGADKLVPIIEVGKLEAISHDVDQYLVGRLTSATGA